MIDLKDVSYSILSHVRTVLCKSNPGKNIRWDPANPNWDPRCVPSGIPPSYGGIPHGIPPNEGGIPP